MQRTTDPERLPEQLAAPNVPTVERADESLVDVVLAGLDAVRAQIDGLEWDDTDATEVLRRLRDERDAQLDAILGTSRSPSEDDGYVEAN